MIDRLIEFSLKKRIPAILLALCVFGIGIWSWNNLKKEAYPDVGDTQVTVVALFPGKAALEVERQVTLPLERELNTVPYVLTRRSKTIFGLSVLQLIFEDGISDFTARQLVLEKIRDADIPEEADVSLAPLTGPVGEIFRYTIEAGEEWTGMDLRTIQDWTVIPALRQVAGVADVINFGGLVKQYHVITSPNRIYRYNLSLQDVIEAVSSNNRNTGGHTLTRGDQSFAVRGLGAIQNADDIRNTVVASSGGTPIYIGNLASVEEYPKRSDGIFSYAIRDPDSSKIKLRESGVQGLIAMRRGENPSEVVARVKAKLEEINRNHLPAGVRLTATYDRSNLVNYTVRTISRTLFEGVSIVVLVLIFFIGSVRSALIVACTIPISLLFAFSMMKLTNIPANLLSLGAIDFGIIVDGAVVIVDNISRKYKEAKEAKKYSGLSYPEIETVTIESAKEVGTEIFFSISIIIFAYLPIFTFQRIEGKLFSPMAFTLAFAILGSMIIALTLIPVLMTYLYRSKLETKGRDSLEWQNPIFLKIRDLYSAFLSVRLIDPKTVVVFAAVLVLGIGSVSYFKLGTEFLPELDEGSINIRCFFPVGVSLRTSEKYVPIIRSSVLKHEQIASVLSQLGRNDEGTDPYGPNRLEILIELKDYSSWKEKISKAELLHRIKKDLQETLPGVGFIFSQPILDNVTESVTGSVSDLAILINGEDLNSLRSLGKEILSVVSEIQGATESGIEQEGDQAQLTIEIDRKQSARYGINTSEILDTMEAAIGGKEVGVLYDGSKRFEIIVRYTNDYRSSIDSVHALLVTGPGGARIPLSELAKIEFKDGPTIIQRQDGKRQISVRTNVRGRDQGSFVAEAREKVAEKIKIPEGIDIHWGGQFENLNRAVQRLRFVIPLTLVAIFLILYVMFKRPRMVLLAMSGIPISISGGLLALLLRGMNFSVSAGVGFISLFGISTMTGVLFISRLLHMISENRAKDLRASVIEAAVIQLRPRIMTILLALLGLIPATIASGIGSDVQRPLATVIVGGLSLELLVTLVYIPCLFYLSEKGGKD
ncbi:CusA/CzcA family heavy metal efflux RND transporter [Leptospira ellisii]|uniref:CusA/CzcA family heavy metal efflux RND transporter n=1 Tax=Leptospira ellisii TaxID=2023197 RepID=A0AAE4QQ66_9LEPT|nr:CusA/CzcA family heavy metal efflux RND transporter [Leptospira ellisii]MDV6237153.1 CusA/CzcA family heavy metal efflux RND transporter [Leptospira ellisii]PKA06315.1 CusA/CzcA family heavy metal efflux RND transporter [Leptospira ellisii]